MSYKISIKIYKRSVGYYSVSKKYNFSEKKIPYHKSYDVGKANLCNFLMETFEETSSEFFTQNAYISELWESDNFHLSLTFADRSIRKRNPNSPLGRKGYSTYAGLTSFREKKRFDMWGDSSFSFLL